MTSRVGLGTSSSTWIQGRSVQCLEFRADVQTLLEGHVTRGNFFLQLATQIWVKKILQAPVEL